MKNLKIIWTKQAKESVKSIYKFYKKKSLQGAENVKSDLLQSPKTIYFSGQYQVDEINPKYRRIVVRDYKVLYDEKEGIIRIVDVVSTKESPETLESK